MMFLTMKMSSIPCMKRVFMKNMLICIRQNFPVTQALPLRLSIHSPKLTVFILMTSTTNCL